MKKIVLLLLVGILGVIVTAQAQTATVDSPREVRIAEGTKLCDQADKLLAEGKVQDALKLYQAALKILPTSPRAKAGVEKAKGAAAAPQATAQPTPPAAPPLPPLPQEDVPVPPQTQGACPPEALAWPTVMATKLQDQIPWKAFYCSVGQYGGGLERAAQAGLRVWGSWTNTAMWLQQPLSDQWLLTVEVGYPKEDKSGQAAIWLNGPGHGTSVKAGYCIQVGRTEGAMYGPGTTGRFTVAPPFAAESYHIVNVLRKGPQFSLWLDGQEIGSFEDTASLSGPLYSRIGIGALGGSEVYYRNLRIQAVPPTPAALTEMSKMPAAPAPTTPPAPNGELLAEVKMDGQNPDWHISMPQSTFWRGDRVILCGTSPRLLWQKGTTQDFAFEADVQYVPRKYPDPLMVPEAQPDRYLATGAAEAELFMFVRFASVVPIDPKDEYQPPPGAGWHFSFNQQDHRLVWRDAEGRQGEATSVPAFCPFGGNRYTVRVEVRHDLIRAYVNGALVTETPLGDHSWPANQKAFAAVGNLFEGVTVYGARIYALQ
ncbi:MAG: hypothetical protein ABFE08_16410 [Armatimonadia bacterium]